MRVFMPIILIAVFALYILYLAVVKREFKSKLKTEILPGMFFVLVWGICYFAFLR